jgi:hypothetical protein
MPWAESSTIRARRQVTTDPLPRLMIRTSRCPSRLDRLGNLIARRLSG